MPPEDIYRRRIASLPPLQQHMLALDTVLTEHPPEEVVRQYHHYPATVEKWITSTEGGNNPIWYLSDSGYSRVVWNPYDEHLFLTYNSTSRVKARWELALSQREALLGYLTHEYNQLRQQLESVQQLVATLLEERTPDLKQLKQHRRALDPEELAQVKQRQAVWSDGRPGVWKAQLEGKTYYVCNTHRACQIKPTLAGAISAFAFIKTTS